MNAKDAKSIHFTGIKGVGMTALALYAQDMGKKVTGSDVAEQFVTEKILKKRKLPVSIGFQGKNIPRDTQLLVFSAAHAQRAQVQEAKNRGIPSLSYAQALAELTQEKEVIATCGVGGKSTTAAMIATILDKARMRPSFTVGVGEIPSLEAPGRYSEGRYAVVEADDYATIPFIDNTPKFLHLKPKVIVVTNIEYDHPDVYQDFRNMKKAFESFFLLLPDDGLLVANIDNPNVEGVVARLRKKRPQVRLETYGQSPRATWRIESVSEKRKKTEASVIFARAKLALTLGVPGRFNVANATAALAVATYLGVSQKISLEALAAFHSTRRRFQRVGKWKEIEVWDDYAHHPREIQATIAAARNWFSGKKLIVVFQPHTYSRTKALLSDFARSLSFADEVIITEIYGSAREKKDPTVSGSVLAQKTSKQQKETRFLKKERVVEYLKENLQSGDVVMTLGAGDIYEIAQQLIGKK